MNDRYQHQPFWIRAYRWWRYMPIAFVAGIVLFPFWWAKLKPSEKADLWGFWTEWRVFRDIYIGTAQSKMNWLYSWDEVKAQAGFKE